MTTLQPPVFRNFGSPVDVTWNENVDSYSAAIVNSIEANYASIAGAETFDLAINGGPPSAIIFAPTDNSLVGIIARINATYPGLAYALSSNIIQLEANSIEISGIGPSEFDKIGFPIIEKDSAVSARPYILIDGEFPLLDRVDKCSNPVLIPPGANSLSLWIEYDLIHASNRKASTSLLISWGEATIFPARPTTTIANLYTDIISLDPTTLTDSFGTTDIAGRLIVPQLNPPEVKITRRVITKEIPAGVDRFFLSALNMNPDGSGDYAFVAPKLSAKATFGARLLKPV